jgi:hypothetical protein
MQVVTRQRVENHFAYNAPAFAAAFALTGRPSPNSTSLATCKCGSTASRAISKCMISVEPSKMRLMRMSRSICSTGTGFALRRTAAEFHGLVALHGSDDRLPLRR